MTARAYCGRILLTTPVSDGSPTRITASASALRHGRHSSLALLVMVPALWVPAFLCAQAAHAQPRAPIIALPQNSTGGTNELYYLDLGSGTVTHGDQLRRDPLAMRSGRLAQNLFQEIGRPVDQPAGLGEVLLGPISATGTTVRAAILVESSTGYVAFFDQLGKNRIFGRFSSALGRPFAPLASPDRNYALLMSHDGNGRSQGAYLYHAGSGQGLYLGGLAKLRNDVEAVAASGFPTLSGQVAAAELQFSDRTIGYLVADAADGSLRFLDLEAVQRITVRDSPVGLFPTFAAEAATATLQRFAVVPIRNSNETTTHVLFVDAASGDLAVLEGVDDSDKAPTLSKMAANLYGALNTDAGAGARTVATVANRSGTGETDGVWLIDSLTRRVAYVEGAETPGSATVRRVRVGG